MFTTNMAHNHLVTLAEVAGMYLLTWSPQLWSHVVLTATDMAEPFRGRYREELGQVRRQLRE